MKNLSTRERYLVTALPAAMLLMIYFFFFARPATDEMNELRRQVSAAEDRVPAAQKIAETAKDLRELEAEIREKRDTARAWEEKSERLLAYWSDPDAKARGGEEIGRLLTANRVVLVEEAVADGADREQFAMLLAALPSAELWNLRLAGSYEAMRKTVAALGTTTLPVVPAAIKMEPKVEGNRSIHLWNLWICR